MSSTPIGHANLWARGADQFGSASGSGAAPGYNVNRAAPFIGGVDWRLDNGIVAGVAATYVASSASFKDGSRNECEFVSRRRLRGLGGRAVVRARKRGRELQRFRARRVCSRPSGFRVARPRRPRAKATPPMRRPDNWVLPAAGANVSVTPYAALDYVHANIDAFNETGGFGALSVNGADGNSFATTLGARATTRINWGEHAVLVPELRLGWSHEFLDASQTLIASLVGVPGSTFSATGIASAATPRSSAPALAWSFRPTPRCSSITTASSASASRSTRFRAGCGLKF